MKLVVKYYILKVILWLLIVYIHFDVIKKAAELILDSLRKILA